MRKKGTNGKESRRRLLDAAAEEFALSGFYQTKVSSIVARAGVTQPAFYLYFESKEEVFAELVDEFQSQLSELVENSRLEPGKAIHDVRNEVQTALVNGFRFLSGNPALTRIGFFQSRESVHIKAKLAMMLEEKMELEREAGYFRTDVDLSFAAEALIGIMERLTLTKLLPGRDDPVHLAEQTRLLLFNGLLLNGD
ncbi:TetR/AcrR family transcriptional regulator [Paenibacillus sp. P96]|uniref:TetR/AcrR family transcriptional regulator n=1 Tax=Paenibacillus zeirhizosphaerae TaxID=2987519 RepID=A0ABT9FLJ1_9BACL|nr:TetR/AcrR family transcriptional regulator [Paenibacillus sp. P96]MDP4095597.1 TetR/AcrR family transcriptional regulator [Paenibacillus sp. P96]